MWARIASFEGGSTEKMRQASEEAMASGEMQMPKGMTGGMVLAAGNDRRMFISYFDSKADIDAAEADFDKMGDELSEDVRGRRTSVNVYEVIWNSWE